MSDLQCPAVLLVASPGDADDDGCLTRVGVTQVRALAQSLAGRRVAAVCSSAMPPAVESAELAARELGVGCRVVPGLEDLDPVTGPGETDVLARYGGALEEIADLHRGETVLVLSHARVMSFALPRLAGSGAGDVLEPASLPACAVAEVRIDADDVTLVSLPSTVDCRTG